MAFKSRDNVRVESIYFNGRKYNRYPDSRNKTHQRYFGRAGHRLHRDVWEHYNGPIPDGYQIHHIDGDTGNNSLENLACLPRRKHREEHAETYTLMNKSEKQLAHLARIRHKASNWHKSEEGRAWHREHAKDSICKPGNAPRFSKKPLVARPCEWCGQLFESRNKRKILCSTACQTARSRYLLGKTSFVHSHWTSKHGAEK